MVLIISCTHATLKPRGVPFPNEVHLAANAFGRVGSRAVLLQQQSGHQASAYLTNAFVGVTYLVQAACLYQMQKNTEQGSAASSTPEQCDMMLRLVKIFALAYYQAKGGGLNKKMAHKTHALVHGLCAALTVASRVCKQSRFRDEHDTAQYFLNDYSCIQTKHNSSFGLVLKQMFNFFDYTQLKQELQACAQSWQEHKDEQAGMPTSCLLTTAIKNAKFPFLLLFAA